MKKIHKALEGVYSETNKYSDDGKVPKNPDMGQKLKARKQEVQVKKIKLSKVKLDQANISTEFLKSLEEVKQSIQKWEDIPPQILTLENDEELEEKEYQDYELWSYDKCKKVLNIYPRSEKAYFRLGILALKETQNERNSSEKEFTSLYSQFIKARACFQEVLDINPDFRRAEVLELIGDSVLKSGKGQQQKALEFYEEANKLVPNSVSLPYKQGKYYETEGDLKTAIELYEKAVENNNTAKSAPLFKLGWAYIRNNELDKGIKKLKEAARIDQQNAEIWNKLGEAFLRMREERLLEKAKDAMRKALTLDTKNYEAFMNLGRVYTKTGEFNLAIKCYK